METPIDFSPAAINDWGRIVGDFCQNRPFLQPGLSFDKNDGEATNIKFVGGMAYRLGASGFSGFQTAVASFAAQREVGGIVLPQEPGRECLVRGTGQQRDRERHCQFERHRRQWIC